MRVVLDTNVVVSVYSSAASPSKLVPLWQGGVITALVSRIILEEYLRVLSYPKFKLSEGDIKGLIQEELLSYCGSGKNIETFACR